MSKFKQSDFRVQEEPKNSGGARVMKVEKPAATQVRSYDLTDLKNGPAQTGAGGYAAVKARFGSLAITDPERSEKKQRDRRFSLHDLARGPLSVEVEEKKALEDRVRQQVAAVEEEARSKAAEQGYAEGLEKGFAEAFKKFQEEGASRLGKLDSFLREAESARGDVFRANERFLIDLIYRIGRMVLLRELSADRQYLLRLARDLIERIGVRENITIRINPQEKETIGMLKEGLEASLGTLKNLNIETSAQVREGGCMIETEWNAIDASVETQLKAIAASLGASGDGVGGSGAASSA